MLWAESGRTLNSCYRHETHGFYPRCLLTKHEDHGPWSMGESYDVRDDYNFKLRNTVFPYIRVYFFSF